MKKTISILGCGWLGKPLAEYLILVGHSVLGSTRTESKINALSLLGIKPFIIDIDNLQENVKSFLESEILIINITSKNLKNYQALVSAIEKSPVKKIIFISSTSVYKATNEIVTEETPTDANSPLVQTEKLFLENRGFKTTVIRFGGLFGYSRKPGNFFTGGKSITDPAATVNMIHRDDCIAIIGKIISQEVWNEVFNACADTHPSKCDFYTKAALDIGNPAPTIEDSGVSHYKIVDNTKVKQFLNLTVIHNDLLNLPID